MATVEWAPSRRDPASGDVLATAKVGGCEVLVRVAADAVDDFGIEACLSVAEEKIEAAMQGAPPPARLDVVTRDFRYKAC